MKLFESFIFTCLLYSLFCAFFLYVDPVAGTHKQRSDNLVTKGKRIELNFFIRMKA